MQNFIFPFQKKHLNLFCIILVLFWHIPSVSHAQFPDEFQKVELITGLKNSINFEFAPDGRIFVLDRYGEIKIYNPSTQSSSSAGILAVFHELEDGLLGVAFDPQFETNNYIYLHYSPISSSVNRVSRFLMNGDQLILSSETTLLEWTTQRECCYHAAGDMDFDSEGNLYIATGDNTNHSQYATLNEGNPNESSENTSSNTNDLRGKILRIKPLSNGSYSIPEGNLFPNGEGGLPEIYVMGARNPFKIFVDKDNTDWLFWGEVGPDANQNSTLGPKGMDEINLTKKSGNYGWPYFSGKNEPYLNTYRTPNFYYDSNNPVNLSIWNTGAEILPPAEQSWLEFFHECYLVGPRYYFDPAISNSKKLPAEFDKVLFFYDFNKSKVWAAKMDEQGNHLSTAQLAPAVVTGAGFIDLKIGPEGQLYILEYGVGCCPGNTGSGKLVRLDYIGEGGNSSPEINMQADVTSGSLPLTINFSSEGTIDIDGDLLTYEWDFQSDGIVDSNLPHPTFVFNTEGIYNVQLKVMDSQGVSSTKSLQIHAGNNAATFQFIYPPDGGMINWYDKLDYSIVVNDIEDGSTADGSIDCSDLNLVPSLGHLNHFHDGLAINSCLGSYFIDASGHNTEGEEDVFLVFNVNYTDGNGLTSFDQIRIHPKTMEAEFYDEEYNTHIIDNTDKLGGGSKALRALTDNAYSVLSGRNLSNINSISYRVASNHGGSIELRADSPTGTLLSTVQVPATGGINTWKTIDAPLVDPGGKHDLYFVFKRASGAEALFDLNYMEFKGSGISIDETPPNVISMQVISSSQIMIKFNEALEKASAEFLGNYSISNGVNINSALLQENRKSVLLATTPIPSQPSSELTINNLKNEAGVAITASIVLDLNVNNTTIRINAGGPAITLTDIPWNQNQYNSGGQQYSNSEIEIENTLSDELYQTEIFGNFTYSIPVPQPGSYSVVLHFAELYHGVSNSKGVGARLFNVDIENGQKTLINYDIFLKAGGPARAIVETFNDVNVLDGVLDIVFTKIKDNAKISAIEILGGEISMDPSITILSPNNGSNVTQPFDINFLVNNWDVGQGTSHIHKIIDGIDAGGVYSLDPISINNLSLGNHTIQLRLMNSNHSPTEYSNSVTLNVVEPSSCPENEFPMQWEEVIIGSEVPYRSVFIFAEDLNGDGLKDIITGGWWYKNPGSPSGIWERKLIGAPMNNMSLIHDFDNDGDLDIFGTRGSYISSEMAWAENDGNGNFTIHTNIPAGTSSFAETFMAGAVIGNFNNVANTQIAIIWNGAESSKSAVQMLNVPADPVNQQWTLTSISSVSHGEAISAGDIDGDGDLDLFQGLSWLRNDGGTWTHFSTGLSLASHIDRSRLVDIDNDGIIDGIVNQIGRNKEVFWITPQADPTLPWTKKTVGTDVDGGLSLDIVDIDFDGDLDIITGEWRDAHRIIAFENDLCDSGTWIKRILHPGGQMDHHDGTQTVDIDNDGDLDLISMGWDVRIPRIYVNNSSTVVTNLPPVVTNPGNRSYLKETSITLQITASDPNPGDVLTFSATGLPASLTINATSGLIQGMIANVGSFPINVVATDQAGLSNQVSFTITITDVGNPNLPPVISNPGNQNYTTGSSITLQVLGSDPNAGDELTYSASGLPASLSINSLSGLIQGSLESGVGNYAVIVRLTDQGGLFDEESFTISVTEAPGGSNVILAINAGGPTTVYNTENWQADQYSTGGSPYVKAHAIEGTLNDKIYQSERYGNFDYQIPVPTGTYSLRLHFAELYFGAIKAGGIGSRVFNVNIENGQSSLQNYDIFQKAGGAKIAVIEQIQGISVSDGFLTISLSSVIDNPKISAIEILSNETQLNLPPLLVNPGNREYTVGAQVSIQIVASDPEQGSLIYSATGLPAGLSLNTNTGLIQGMITGDPGSYGVTIRATDQEGLFDQKSFTIIVTEVSTGNVLVYAINAGGPFVSFTDEQWQIDQFFEGGGTYKKSLSIDGTLNDKIYQTERNGIFSYEFPVLNGEYGIKLHFAELFFGGVRAGGIGSRVFGVDIEDGQAQLTNYDIFQSAGGAKIAIIEAFDQINVSDGFLSIEFIPVVENPKISAIEIFTTNPTTNSGEFSGSYESVRDALEEKQNEGSYKLYPNPTSGDVTLETYRASNEILNLTLVDNVGKVRSLGKFKLTEGMNKINLNVRDFRLPIGLYFLKIESKLHSPKVFKLYVGE